MGVLCEIDQREKLREGALCEESSCLAFRSTSQRAGKLPLALSFSSPHYQERGCRPVRQTHTHVRIFMHIHMARAVALLECCQQVIGMLKTAGLMVIDR